MGRKSASNKKTVRSRQIMIYTFLLILALFYASAHLKLEKERAETASSKPPAEKELETANYQEDMPAQENQESLTIRAEDMWSLILTNAEYPVPEDYSVALKRLPGTEQSVDERIYEPLMRMLTDMKADGLSPVVCSAYRTLDKQEMLFNRKVKNYVKQGNSWERSYELARQIISIPGSGEHCLGLAVDFFTESYQRLEPGFEKTAESMWLQEHAQDYGFILRYGDGKENITGIQYEPWHYRYVGEEAARYIREHGLTLEEFYIEQSLYG